MAFVLVITLAFHPIPTLAAGQNQPDNGGNQNQPGIGNNVPGTGGDQPDGCTVVDGVPYNC